MSCALALIALGVGYLVLLQAGKEKEGLKLLGQAIGILIMIGAVASLLCSSMKCGKSGYGKSGCPMSSQKAMCPVSAEKLAGAPQQ